MPRYRGRLREMLAAASRMEADNDMRRLVIRTSQVMVDMAVLALAYVLAFLLRFEGWPELWMLKRLILTWPYVAGLQYLVLVALGVPRLAWSYVGLREVRRI